MRDICQVFGPAFSIAEACAIVDFDLNRCDIILSEDFPEHEEHEQQHCKGMDHVGGNTLERAWQEWKSKRKP